MLSQRNVIATNSGVVGASRRFGAWLTTPLRRAIASLRAAHRLRRARAELTALDDRLLADIGLVRARIWSAVHAAHDHVGESVDTRVSRREVMHLVCLRAPF